MWRRARVLRYRGERQCADTTARAELGDAECRLELRLVGTSGRDLGAASQHDGIFTVQAWTQLADDLEIHRVGSVDAQEHLRIELGDEAGQRVLMQVQAIRPDAHVVVRGLEA